MTTTKSFRETVAARAANDLNFRYGLLTESLDCATTSMPPLGLRLWQRASANPLKASCGC